MNENIIHIAVDLGYGYVKALSSDGERVIFPTIVGTGGGVEIGGFMTENKNDIKNIHIIYKGKDYFVGELAKESRSSSRVFEQDRINHEYTNILLNVAIQILTKGKTNKVRLSTGLPLGYYSSQAKKFRESLLGMQPTIKWKSGNLSGKNIQNYIVDSVVFPQGVSAIYSALNDNRGAYTHEHLMDSGTIIALIDIGFRTTDFVVVEIQDNGSFSIRKNLSNTIDGGVSDLHREITQYYKSQTGGADLNEFHLGRILKNGYLTYRGKRIEFDQVIHDSKSSIATNISDRLKSFWGEESDLFDHVFLAGGGGKLFYEYIKPFLHNQVSLAKDSQFANVIGYYRYGNAYFRRKQVKD